MVVMEGDVSCDTSVLSNPITRISSEFKRYDIRTDKTAIYSLF